MSEQTMLLLEENKELKLKIEAYENAREEMMVIIKELRSDLYELREVLGLER